MSKNGRGILKLVDYFKVALNPCDEYVDKHRKKFGLVEKK